MKILEIKTVVFGEEVDDWMENGSQILDDRQMDEIKSGKEIVLQRTSGSHTYYKLTNPDLLNSENK
jgi:hypothetical protein